jgi:RimK family alpha-L-glutamate ligase
VSVKSDLAAIYPKEIINTLTRTPVVFKERNVKTWIIQQKRSAATRYETTRLIEEGGPGTELILHPSIDIIVSREDRGSIRVRNRVVDLPDVIIPRTGSGTGYFGLAILRHLERLGIPIVNHSDSVEATRDKLYAHQILAAEGVPTPKTILVRHPVNANLVERELGFPAVIKLFAGSYGKGVYLVESKEKFKDFVEFAHGIKSDEAIIVQRYISQRPGQDVRVFVVGGKVIGAMQRSSLDGSFKANIARGGMGENYPVDAALEEISLRVAQALELDVAGVDLLHGPDGSYLVCEANSAPGFQGFEKATGVNVAKAIIKYANTKV